MKVVALQQNTPEWESWRKGKIGGSSAPIIMEVSPWGTPFTLWGELTGLRPVDRSQNSYILDKGHRYEPRARALYELQRDIDMPALCGEHPEYPFLIVSLDGCNREQGRGAEIKLLGKEDFRRLVVDREIPEKYVPQVHHQHMVGDLEVIDFIGYNEYVDEIAIVEVPRDRKYERALLERELKFYELVQKQEPPELTARDRLELTSKEHVQLIRQFLKAADAVKRAEAKLESTKAAEALAAAKKRYEELQALVQGLAEDHPLVECEGVKITRFYTRGSVDWAKVPLPEGVDPEKYRKKGRWATKVTLPKS